MANQVCSGAIISCPFGSAPSTLTVLPTSTVNTSNMPAATIMDYTPLVNIMSFGTCSSPSNPTVAAATSAAMGVLTPMPCVPATVSPWSPGVSDVCIGKLTALDDSSTCNCMWGGSISITFAGQVQTTAS
ncbi:DUF4280 domain-containing protein [uncultured Aquimarina sp.]|uniref:DUF4280 domain-containing protein n=1 Tax=uncultured Aquimarina sp. TaxID=575652 RepID=UPI00261BCD81|nr:DUF4280 domain-containing protein [uncultured Aquimarina sp.]